MLDLGSIPCSAFSNKKGQREDSTVCSRQDEAAKQEDQNKVSLLPPGQSNLENTTK